MLVHSGLSNAASMTSVAAELIHLDWSLLFVPLKAQYPDPLSSIKCPPIAPLLIGLIGYGAITQPLNWSVQQLDHLLGTWKDQHWVGINSRKEEKVSAENLSKFKVMNTKICPCDCTSTDDWRNVFVLSHKTYHKYKRNKVIIKTWRVPKYTQTCSCHVCTVSS